MPECPLADECPRFSERIEGMGCQYYGDRGGKEWCNSYGKPIDELKTAPVVQGQEVEVTVNDLHESGAGVGRTEDGFVVLVDGILPEARASVRVDTVKSNFARGELIERLPDEPEEDETETTETEDDADEAEGEDEEERDRRSDDAPELGSRDNFWG
jgi:predicted RNA-binding protein with TRAM domain